MHCDVISCVICISNEVEYLAKEELKKFYQRSDIVILSDLCNAIKNSWTKFRFTVTLRAWLHSLQEKFAILSLNLLAIR